MSDNNDAQEALQLVKTQRNLETDLAHLFAPEDEGLRHALTAAQAGGLPQIQISPLQGKLLQVLSATCQARKILEIGSLAGYSGIWLARALPAEGRLITLEINPHHAEVVRGSFARAGVADRAEVRVGKAVDLLPALQSEAPFDLVFIDADKPSYPQYLDWALRLTRPGSIIVADNCVRGGKVLHASDDEATNAIFTYNQRVASDPRLVSLALAMDDDFTDGFAIAVVR